VTNTLIFHTRKYLRVPKRTLAWNSIHRAGGTGIPGNDEKSPRQMARASPLSSCPLSNYQFSSSRLSANASKRSMRKNSL